MNQKRLGKNLDIRFIDLFAGMGGFRLGFENACAEIGINPICVFTSDIKNHAVKTYQENFGEEKIQGDITEIDEKSIPSFDVLLAGFPCQAFSSAGNRQGFQDTRGTLFFEIERILRFHKPESFILENVEGLVNHQKLSKNDQIGETLRTILNVLEDIGYKVTWKVLDSSHFGLAQIRKRIYIVGHLQHKVSLTGFGKKIALLKNVLESGLPLIENKTTKALLKRYSIEELHGKSIKDKRGGKNNIHSWDLDLKGKTTKRQKELLNTILRFRRNKKWGELKGIEWMDGMPLTLNEIKSFINYKELKSDLIDLTQKKYIVFEHPKDIKKVKVGDKYILKRIEREDLPKGYNIVTGKLSFEINKILDPNGFCPTLVATDLDRFAVIDGSGIRLLSQIEKLRLFGFPDKFKMPVKNSEADDLLGNTVCVSVVKEISLRLLQKKDEHINKIDHLNDFKQLTISLN